MIILFLADTGFTDDPRIIREAVALQEAGHKLTVICAKSDNLPEKGVYRDITYHRLHDGRVFNIRQQKYVQLLANQIASQFDFDVLHCHNESMLNLAVLIKQIKQSLIVYDSHELFHAWPLNISNGGWWLGLKSRIARKLAVKRERKNGKQVDYFITVCDSLADDLQKYFHLKSRPLVLRNVQEVVASPEKHDILRKFFHIPANTRILVFIGAHIYPNTLNIEQVVDETCNKEKTALVIICADDDGKKAIERYAINKEMRNIYFHDLIRPEQIPAYLSSADVGLVPTWNKNDLSYWYALDNKLFEYLMAEIPVLATKQPEYIRIIETHEAGVCVNPEISNAYYNGFIEILNNYSLYKENVLKTKKVLNWDQEKTALVEFYENIEKEL